MRRSGKGVDRKLKIVEADDVEHFLLELESDTCWRIEMKHPNGEITEIKIFSRSGEDAVDATCKFDAKA